MPAYFINVEVDCVRCGDSVVVLVQLARDAQHEMFSPPPLVIDDNDLVNKMSAATWGAAGADRWLCPHCRMDVST